MAALILSLALLAQAALPCRAAGASETGPKSCPGLSLEELGRLASGEPVLRSFKDPRLLLLAVPPSRVDAVRKRIASLNPNYATEMLLVLPLKKGDDPLARLSRVLMDVEGYVRIPYRSRRHQQTFALFDAVRTLSVERRADGADIVALQRMNPFDEFTARYSSRTAGRPGSGDYSLWFESGNATPVVYEGVHAVDAGQMTCLLSVSSWKGLLLCYGIGMMRTWDLFGLVRDRIEAAFLGREESFLVYMGDRLR